MCGTKETNSENLIRQDDSGGAAYLCHQNALIHNNNRQLNDVSHLSVLIHWLKWCAHMFSMYAIFAQSTRSKAILSPAITVLKSVSRYQLKNNILIHGPFVGGRSRKCTLLYRSTDDIVAMAFVHQTYSLSRIQYSPTMNYVCECVTKYAFQLKTQIESFACN